MIDLKKFWTKYKEYILSVAIALGVGALSGLISGSESANYEMLARPPLSPPPWLFPVVWTILYVLMGISAAIIYRSDSANKTDALFIYAAQLAANFLWPIFYFVLNARLLALVWLVFLLFLVIYMISKFYDISKVAAYMNVPYVFWLVFAFYLNLGTYLLNR